LALNTVLSVKILTVHPGCRLSLQRHMRRDEWWHVLDNDLVVEIDGAERAVDVGDRVWIPRGTTHRIANRGTVSARFLELAYGHFDEDDIERLADDFARVPASLAERS
jgi:mannose-6-phosphate isomerase